MGGQPFQRKIEGVMDKLGKEEGLEGTPPFESPGEEWVFMRRAEGLSWGKIGDLLGCSRQLVAYQWRREKGKREHREELSRVADKLAAEAHAEDSGDVLEDLSERAENGHMLTAPEVTLAKARSGHRRWMAEMADPDRYGKQPDVAVQLSVGEMHLDAIRRRRVDVERPATLEAGDRPLGIEAGD